jgi:hypothetical protein
MNHYVSLVVFSVIVASLFTTISKEAENRRTRYFLIMLGWMAVGSLLAAWLMYFIPW